MFKLLPKIKTKGTCKFVAEFWHKISGIIFTTAMFFSTTIYVLWAFNAINVEDENLPYLVDPINFIYIAITLFAAAYGCYRRGVYLFMLSESLKDE